MTSAMLTADWFLLGRDIYFRKFEIYSLNWVQHADLADYILSTAMYGGPIAIKRDDKKFIKESGQPIISIFKASGKKIVSFKWTKKPIVRMGWSKDEKLICIQEDGVVALYDMFGRDFHDFVVSPRVQELKVSDAKIFTSAQNSTGIVVMTKNYKFFLINNIEKPKNRQLSDLSRGLTPTCWAVLPEETQTDVLVACGRDIFKLRQDEHQISSTLEVDITNSYCQILEIAVSFNSRHIALFTDSGHLWLGSSNFRSKYCEVDTGNCHRPTQLVWCGNEAVVAYWESDSTVLIVGKHGQKMDYSYFGAVHLVQEIDGVRIISQTQHEFLQKVPDVVQKIFRINSTEPGSYLMEASKQFQKRSHRANEYISLVKNDLQKAVEQCIEAVGYEFDTEVQKTLIRAAQFGKCFIPDINTDKYVQMCRLLRVLNDIRNPRIGIPLSLTQLNHIHLKVLLDRLITRKEYFLALEIAKYLQIPDSEGKNHILVNWAKYKVSQPQLEDETVAREIAEKLGYTPGISYCEVAKAAAESGRKKIAIKLLDYESKPREQIDLLLNLGEFIPALIKSIESGDTELVYTVILKLREEMKSYDFKMTIRSYPIALSLYIKYCKLHNPEALLEIYHQEDDHCAKAENFIMQSFLNKENQDASLNGAADAYKKGGKDLYSSMCDETFKLIRFQRGLEEKRGVKNHFYGKSVHDTCILLMREEGLVAAEKFKNDFKIPDKRYCWIRVQYLVEKNQWDELEKFSKVKKSSISYPVIVDACLKSNHRDEALKYLPKVPDDLKVKYYTKARYYEQAAQVAFNQKDKQNLIYVQSKCMGNTQLVEKINTMIAQLESRR